MKPDIKVSVVCEAEVSIPKRVSEALKLARIQQLESEIKVSIPKRVSEALKHFASNQDIKAANRFNP